MKKFILMTALLTAVGCYGFKRDCEGLGGKNYTYSITLVDSEGATACHVWLASSEKDFIRETLKAYQANTKVTRKFYVDNVKNKFNPNKLKKGQRSDQINALLRVTRDFGGTKGSRVRTIGDIRKMLDGKLKDLDTVQQNF